MKKLFFEVGSLDRRCYESYGLSEDILMEHAASAMAEFIKKKFEQKSSILIACGGGNNGADGIALGRMLHKDFDVRLFIPFGTKSGMGRLQLERAQKIGVPIVDDIAACDVLVDCLFGSGLDGALDEKSIKIIEKMNALDTYKLACDVPSGLDKYGTPQGAVFKADTTITMGALKISLFSDTAKDFVGTVEVADLGVSKEVYEKDSNYLLLEKSDLKLPHRTRKNTHKGDFGHVAVVAGEKEGAAILAAQAALGFGAGLVTIVSKEKLHISPELMQESHIPDGANTVCIGMGLGRYIDCRASSEARNDGLCDEFTTKQSTLTKSLIKSELFSRNLVIDADLFYDTAILELLEKHNNQKVDCSTSVGNDGHCEGLARSNPNDERGIVITPHPKEFASLLKLCGIGDLRVDEIQNRRFELAEKFSHKYPNIVLLLKGANTIIAKEGKLFVNPLGTAALAKGGSGDVLGGLIASLLAQGYTPLDAAISGSLAHSVASQGVKNNYALTPLALIEAIKLL